jgi:hypothetical protein
MAGYIETINDEIKTPNTYNKTIVMNNETLADCIESRLPFR